MNKYLISEIAERLREDRVIQFSDLKAAVAAHPDYAKFEERVIELIAQKQIRVVSRIDEIIVPRLLVWSAEYDSPTGDE
jgi:hypothetical protein